MAISHKDYQQWFDTGWMPVDEGVKTVTGGLDELSVMFVDLKFSENGRVFAEATEDMVLDSIPGKISKTRGLLVDAKRQLRQVDTDEHRAVDRLGANQIIDNAIQKSDQLYSQL